MQRRFVEEYIVSMNATQAAKKAGYAGTDVVLAVTGSQLLRNPKVLERLEKHLAQYTMSANEVLIHLTDIARGDFAYVLNTQGGIDPLHAAQMGKSHLIKRFKTKTTITTKADEDGRGVDSEVFEAEIEMYDRLKALELLAKFHDLVNRVKIDDWRTQAIADIRDGRVSYDAMCRAFSPSLADQLFAAAGVVIMGELESGE